ncbi:endonuclease/exonuclease/phosphatase family protein [Flavobacterium sp. ZS1P14]|uniref:endonuclease/exonuclease/phosphatase family protein n=1 Tax=Flavobacterium sp. ZS1P14 TaxID=3401729 RepID=UPI003AADA82A
MLPSRKYPTVLLLLLFSIFMNAQRLKIVTYNIRLDLASDGENAWSKRKDYFAGQLQFYEPDIFGVQEATPVQVTDISTLLPQYASIGIARDGIGKGEASNIYFKKDRLAVIESSTFWLSETPDMISKGWDAAYNRVCTYGLFKDLKTRKKFWVFNTHLDHVGETAKTKGLQLILSKIKQLNSKNYPVVFMGDLNSEPETNRIIEIKKVMNDSREISAQPPFGPSGTFNAFRHDLPVTRLIDYIFLSKDSAIKVTKYAVLSDSKDLKYPSDHLPVYIEINFK